MSRELGFSIETFLKCSNQIRLATVFSCIVVFRSGNGGRTVLCFITCVFSCLTSRSSSAILGNKDFTEVEFFFYIKWSHLWSKQLYMRWCCLSRSYFCTFFNLHFCMKFPPKYRHFCVRCNSIFIKIRQNNGGQINANNWPLSCIGSNASFYKEAILLIKLFHKDQNYFLVQLYNSASAITYKEWEQGLPVWFIHTSWRFRVS